MKKKPPSNFVVSMPFMVKFFDLEVDSLLFNNQRSLENLSVNGAYVFTKHADEEELHRSKEKKTDHQRSRPDRETIPEDQLIDEVNKRHDKTKDRHHKS